jgi:copper transport protein
MRPVSPPVSPVPGPSSGAPVEPPAHRLRWWLVAALVLVSLGPLSGVAAAHATLVDSVPGNDELVDRAPERVRLVFDDGVTAEAGGVRIIAPDGSRVERGAPERADGGREVLQDVAEGPAGTYTVSYSVLSDDGHVISGSFVYHVERRTGAAEVDEGGGAAGVVGAVGRWGAFAGAVLAAGVLAVASLVDRRGPAGLADRRALLLGAAGLTLAGTLLALWGSAAELAAGSLGDGFGQIPDLVTGSRPGIVMGLRVAAAVALLVAVGVRPLLRAVPWAAAALAVVSLLLPSLGGHASATSPVLVAVGADALHLLAVAAWMGGLAVLAATWVPDHERLVRFSRVALVAAPVVVATGALQAWLHTRSVAGLTDTDYGRLVLAKAAGTAALLALGFVHRRWLADAARSVASMVAGVRAEVALGVAVLGVTAVLVGTPPATDTLVEPVERVGQAGDTTVRLDVTPARAGANEVHVFFQSLDGSTAAVDAAELQVATRGVASRVVPLTAVSPNHSVATGVQLTPGTWRFRLVVVREGVPAETTLEVPIR